MTFRNGKRHWRHTFAIPVPTSLPYKKMNRHINFCGITAPASKAELSTVIVLDVVIYLMPNAGCVHIAGNADGGLGRCNCTYLVSVLDAGCVNTVSDPDGVVDRARVVLELHLYRLHLLVVDELMCHGLSVTPTHHM